MAKIVVECADPNDQKAVWVAALQWVLETTSQPAVEADGNEEIQRLTEALKVYQLFNRLGNDLDAYLYAFAEYALNAKCKKE